MENPYQGQLNYSHNSEDDQETHQRKPYKGYQGTPGEKESYEHHHHQRNSNEGSADVYTESHQGTHEDDESQDLRRKGELNNAIFIKLQEISRYNVEIGNYQEGLVNYDRCIEHLLRTLPEGPSSAIFQEFLYITVKSLNEVALKLLQEGKLKDSLLLLERCRKMTHPNSFGSYPTLRSLTYNHLGCCYRRIGKLDKALYYLEKAWEFIQGIEKVDTSGITHINLCAVLSQLGDHRKALDHAKMAVSDCAYDLIEATKKNSIEDNHNDVNKKATMLAIAYHNLATEEEACKNPDAALQAYLRAFNLISEHNHPQHELCTKFGRAYEEARARLVKPGQRRTMSPGSQQRKYGKSPPPNITVKRPPSLNTASKAAKAYLQNNKVVIPRRKVPPMNQTRPMTSHGVSPNNNPLNNQKLYVPMASMPQKRNERPVTAHPQSRTQHYQIHGVNETPPNQNGRPGTGKHERETEQNRPSESELGSDVERFGLDEEDIEQTDLKSNRLAFLQSLNQYNTQSNVSKGSDTAAQRNNFLSEEHQHHQGEERHPPPTKALKKRGNQEVDHEKVHAATLKLQSFCRGHQARQEVARVMAEVPQPVFLILIAETMKGNLENGPTTKETLYYFLMMYELHSQIIHIHIKNLENKRFHKALVEYQVVNRTSKEAIIDELREACEKLIQHLEIHHDQIVFRDELGAEEAIPEDVYMMGQDIARRDPENVITEITERTDERTDESEGKIVGSRQEEDVNSDGNLRFSHNEEKQVEEEEVVDEIAEEDNKYGEEVFEEEKPQHSPQEEDINFDEEDQIEVDEEEERTHEPIVDTKEVAGLVGLHLLGGPNKDKKIEESALKIQRNIRGKLARDKYKLFKNKKFKVVFSRCLNVQGNILGFRLVEGPSFHDQYGLFCYDFTKSKQFEAIAIPEHLVDLSNLTVQELRSMLNIDLLTLQVHLKPEIKDKKSHHHHHEEVPKEKSEPASASSRKQPSQEMASERKSSRREHHEDEEEVLASVPLHFGKEKIDSTIHYNKKADKILVRHGSGKKLEIPVSELEIDTEFSKPHFVNNMDIILLSRLSYKNGALTYDKSPHAQIPPPKQEEALPNLEDPEVLQATSTTQKAYRKKQNQAKEQKPQPKETQDTKHPNEEEIIEERGSHQKKLTVPNNRYSQKALEEPEVSSPGLKDSAARFDSNRSANLFVNQESEELFNSGKNDQIRSINADAPNELGHFRGEQIEEGTESKRQKTTKKDDSLPDLNDPEVQGATLKIQNAYKKKQAKGSEKKKEEIVVEQPKEVKPSKKEEEEEELPNLEDPDVQNASLKIQKAYLKKKDRQNKKAEEVKPKQPENPSKKEEEEELPNLEDPDVQNASLKIQKAYLKKKDRQNKKAEEEKPKEPEKPSKKEEKEELPNLEDPEVQNASLTIQQAYLRRKNKQNKKAKEEEKPKEPEKISKKEEEEELPNLEDPDVQNASLKIQKAYLKKKDRQNKKAEEVKPKQPEKPSKKEEKQELPNLEDPEVQNASLTIQQAYLKRKNRQNKKAEEVKPKQPEKPSKKEEEEELPNLEDPDVQNASLKIQQAYLKKKDRQNKKAEEVKPKQPEKPSKKEEEEELPNLEDPDVQNASLKIQKAYLKKKDRQNKKAEEVKPKQPEKPSKNEEEDELPNLEDPDVQNASLKIQKAYLKKKDKQNKKAQEVPQPKEEKIPSPKKQKEEEEELPNLEDPDVQNASLKIQQAYLKKKNNKKAAAPQKEEVIAQKPAVPEKKVEEDAYEDEFEKESPSPVKEQKQEAKQQPKTTHHAEPEFGLKEVGDEFDVFDKEDKERDALKRPGTAKVEKQTTKEVKPQHTDEDFEPLDEDF